MTKVEISTLISRYLWNELSPEERKMLFTWVNADKTNEYTFKRCTDIDSVMARIDHLLSFDEKASIQQPIEQNKIFRLLKNFNRFKNRRLKLI